MNQKDSSHEDRAILRILEDLDATGDRAVGAEQAVEREYTETLGLLAYGSEPLQAPPRVKEAVLAAVRKAPGTPRAAAPFRAARSGARHRAGGWLPLTLAASLLLANLGFTAKLFLDLERSEAEVAALSAQISVYQQRGGNGEARLARFVQPGVEMCALRPVGEAPLQPRARALLYLDLKTRTWMLFASGLSQPAGGQVYQVWFDSAGGERINGGFLEVKANAAVRTSVGEVPEKMTAVYVTIEPSGGAPMPTGPRVLYGNEQMDVL